MEKDLPAGIAFIFIMTTGLVQICLGFLGIEYLSHTIFAFLAVFLLFFARIVLPLTIGTYFGAVEVMGWEWYVGVLLAAPGLFFILPSMLMATIEPFLTRSKSTSTGSQLYSDYSETKSVSPIIEHELLGDIEPKPPLKKTETLLDSPRFENSKTVLEYDPDGYAIWKEIEELDSHVVEDFLISLENNPKQDLKTLRDQFFDKIEKANNPYDNPEANKAFREALEISQSAQDEFVKVYDLMRDKLKPHEILDKIKVKQVEKDEAERSAFRLRLYQNWENDLVLAEQSGKIDVILRALSQIGYKIDISNNSITRPEVGLPVPLKNKVLHFTNAHDLMRLVASERRLIIQL